MKNAFRALDRILRGDATRVSTLKQGNFDIPASGLFWLIVVLSMIYGACMGLSSVIVRWSTDSRSTGFLQLGSSMVKLPMLFILTVLITFPSLYVFNALMGSRLTVRAMLKLLIAAMSVMLALLTSFGPIVSFFSVSTTASYPFVKLLHLVVFTVAGTMGLKFLFQTLHRLTLSQAFSAPLEPLSSGTSPSAAPQPVAPPTPPPISPPPLHPYTSTTSASSTHSTVAQSLEDAANQARIRAGALDRVIDQPPPANVKAIFRIWVIVFGLVGAQMGWCLRPFIGDPELPFTFLRGRESNIFEGVANTVDHLFNGRTRTWRQ